MAVNDRIDSSRQVCSTLVYWYRSVAGVLMSASSIRRSLLHRGLCARIPFHQEDPRHGKPLTAESTIGLWASDRHQVVSLGKSRFSLWGHDGHVHVRRYADQRCLPESVIKRHRTPTPGDIVSSTLSYHRRSNLLRIEGSLNINSYIHKLLQSELFIFLKRSISGAIFQQDNARQYVAETVRDFYSAQHILPWPAYSPDFLPIEHMWGLVDRCLALDPRPAVSKDEL